ncbi:protein kinase domain-containing protein [Dictyobacter arantiisoli]|uniref:Protein kinase domain-containing protein n=1 Tax=Dictyobacter arantiisoli TaxID=2014874 RepID=A0A5A5T829_9CHLR|nr:protein kinase [Dictyobacter arantiisoli]GCF07630.1 hypothetical protein KDI_11940 [Dictyobacter arantiisoli]
MQTLTEDHLVGQVLGQYRIERFVGKGHVNVVYLARHQTEQRVDALTLYLIPERLSLEARTLLLTRFRKEAASITSLKHAHILPIYDYGVVADHPYLVTPYAMHGSLSDTLKQQGRSDYTRVGMWLNQIVDGLDYAHRHGFVHGTLKPSNIVWREDDTLMVAGFGLMHMLQLSGLEQSTAPYAHLLSISGTFLMAPEYVAPEVVQGQSVDQRSDVYALGCILFELLSGQPPFQGSDPWAVAQLHVKQTVPSLRTFCPDVPLVLASVVGQALARNPSERFQYVRELGEAFAQAAIGATQSSIPIPVIRKNATASNAMGAVPETPRLGSLSSNNWQLLPPIVTGRMPAVNIAATAASAQAGMRQSTNQPAVKVSSYAAQAPKNEAYMVAAPPTLPPTPPANPPVRGAAQSPSSKRPASPAQPDVQAAVKKNMPENAAALPNAGVTLSGDPAQQAELAKAYEWWSPSDSMPGAASASAAKNANAVPAPAASTRSVSPQPEASKNANESMQLTDADMFDWGMTATPSKKRRKQTSPLGMAQSGGKMKRRRVIAMIGGGVVAATGLAFAVHAINPGLGQLAQQGGTQNPPTAGQKQASTTKTGPTAQTKTTTPPKKTGGTTPAKAAPAGHTGTVIGSTRQATNSASMFIDPANQQGALLVHLANGNFAAYDRACTHVGVAVNYDPASKMFVCPAHGAIFDPARNGAVVQGPAMRPLPAVKISVNGDGTVTALANA